MIPVITTAPTEEPLSLVEAKLHLRVTVSTEDALITSLILAARERCEELSARSFVTRTYALYLDGWPCGDSLLLPMPPIQSVTSVTYVDSAGVTQTMPSSDYYLAASGGRLVLAYGAGWPATALRGRESVIVRYVAGYGAASVVPAWCKHSMRLLLAHWYMNREEVTSGTVGHRLPEAAQEILMSNKAY
jgi:uncharacterized phiE125 gp8 family phage protein